MITTKNAEIILKQEYHVDNFLYLLDEVLLPDFKKDVHKVVFNNRLFKSVSQLGESKVCDIAIYEVVLLPGVENRRVAITQEMFRILRGQGINNAVVAFANADANNYRISLLTSKYEFDGDKIVKVISNPRRYSYSLGFGTKTKTAYKFLIEKGKVNSLEDLTARFSVEVVNKQFYREIALAFTKLIGGQREGETYPKELTLQGVSDQNKYAEFAVRLIGRLIFCWFLKEKKSEKGIPLIPEEMLSCEAVSKTQNYYHDILEPLFFELLNTNQNRRKDKFLTNEYYNQIPYLNGGLFSPHADDRYKYSPETETGKYGVVTIPNSWFSSLLGVLSQYNFTVDENTSYDIELSIDPEMLGRIFENLLAEINPETGENAKKSTGSFYTPRDIVDYMVDSSILEYLKTKTDIDEVRLKALISYSKEDDELATFDTREKKLIIDALYSVTVLDPACGSGAFPIGMLQKIVYMLQEIDPEANLWFDEIVKGAPIYVKKAFEEKFSNGELDYIRKLTVIEKSIYGVDIQPVAVEIARLRCFLSLVIEQKVNDSLPNRGVHPLPSLDFKFLTANSLVKLSSDNFTCTGEKIDQLSIFENIDHIEELKAVREEYFNADNQRKAELREEFGDIQKRMFQQAYYMNNKNASPRYSALFNWSPFKDEPTNWFDPEWMFGIKDGFDIIIGNPPYVDYRKIDGTIKNAVKDFVTYKETKMGSLYIYFLELSYNLAKESGVICFINPCQYLTADSGKGLRKLIMKGLVLYRLVDVSNLYIFDSANTYTCVNIFYKNRGLDKIICHKPENIYNLEHKTVEIRYDEIKSNSTYQIVVNNNSILNKINDNKLLLKSLCTIVVGSSYSGFRKFVKNEQLNSGYFPLVESSDISKFSFTSKAYVEGKIYSKKVSDMFNCDYLLYMARMTKEIRVCIGKKGYYLGKANLIVCRNENILYGLLVLLNSKLIDYYYRNKNEAKHLNGGYLGMDIPSVECIPIFASFFNENWKNLYLNNTMDEINEIIYKSYKLTDTEIEEIENSVKK